MWFLGLLPFFLDNNLSNLACISPSIHGVSVKFQSGWRICHTVQGCQTSWDIVGELYQPQGAMWTLELPLSNPLPHTLKYFP